MYDSYGRWIGYPVYVVTYGNHDFKFDSKIDSENFVTKLENRYAQHGLSAKGKYSMHEEWHSGF